jgi:hypothetical protein
MGSSTTDGFLLRIMRLTRRPASFCNRKTRELGFPARFHSSSSSSFDLKPETTEEKNAAVAGNIGTVPVSVVETA